MSFSRCALGASIALALAAPAFAADPSLRVLRAVGNQDIPLSSVTYDIANKRLVATTVAGNYACNAPTSIPDGALHLQLDGTANRYPIKTTGLTGGAAPIEYDPATSRFQFTLENIIGGGCASTGQTIYTLTFAGQQALDVSTAVQFDLPTRTFNLGVRDPVLCTSYAAASSGVTIALTDPNGTSTSLPGLTSVPYAVNPNFDLRPVASTVERYDFDFPLVQCAAPGATASSGGGPVDPAPVGFFRGDFEPPILRGNVAVAVNVPGVDAGVLGTLPGAAFGYTFTVANSGNGDARNVRIKEYVPQASGSDPAVVLQGTSGWTCTTSNAVACPVGNGVQELPINLSGLTIPAGETWTFTVSLSLRGDVPIDEIGDIGYAAFVDPTTDAGAPNAGPDTNLSNNAAWFRVKAVPNQLPTFSAVANQSFAEDASAQSVAFSVSDPENDAIGTPTASSSDTALFPNGSLVVVPGASANAYTLQMTPAAHKNGTATITLTAAATQGTMTPATRTFDVTVTAVNDDPQFTLSAAEVTANAGSTCPTGGACASATDLLTNLQPGPAAATDESTQTVTPANLVSVVGVTGGRMPAGACVAAASNGVDPATFFTSGLMPLLLGPNPSGGYSLMAGITQTPGAVTCSIAVRDSASGTSATQTFDIRYTP